jgi:tetratricopeptide (TPR) repeat protein
MTGRIEKTIFISYRRTNVPWALAIYQDLTNQGYDVFFDYLSIKSGDFEKIIIENIKARAHFIVILTPSALERCNEPGDWLRREIETAMDEKRNVVPLMLEGFDYGNPLIDKALTGKLRKLKSYNSLRIHSDYFFEGMNRLREKFLNISLDSVIHPVSGNTRQLTTEHQVAASRARQVEQRELTAQEWYEKGRSLSIDAELESASNAYEKAVNLDPDFVDAWENKIQVDLELNRKTEVSESIPRLINLYRKEIEEAETKFETDKGYWVSQAENDRLFGKQSSSMDDYYDNEVLASYRGHTDISTEIENKIKSLEALLRKIKGSE